MYKVIFVTGIAALGLAACGAATSTTVANDPSTPAPTAVPTPSSDKCIMELSVSSLGETVVVDYTSLLPAGSDVGALCTEVVQNLNSTQTAFVYSVLPGIPSGYALACHTGIGDIYDNGAGTGTAVCTELQGTTSAT